MLRKICALSFLLALIVESYEQESYSQVSTTGSGHQDGPKLFKALSMDLIFPKTFNSSENVISTTKPPDQALIDAVESLSPTADEQFTPGSSSQQSAPPEQPPQPAAANEYTGIFVTPDNHADESENDEVTVLPTTATGRAVDYRPAYPFSQLLTPNSKGYRPSAESYPLRSRPVAKPSTGAHRVVYPSYQASRTPSRAEIDKLSGKGQNLDRSKFPQSHPVRWYPTQQPPYESFTAKAYSTDSLQPVALLLAKTETGSPTEGMPNDTDNEVINYGRAFNLPKTSKLSQFLEALSEAHAAEGRVKKYSYFYIARWAWYMPLYFSVWLSFYTIWLIYKSISHHWSTLPGIYKDQVRGLDEIDQRDVRDIIDSLTLTVMSGQFSDRFTPSEAVVSSAFKQKAQNLNRKPSITRPIGQSSNKVSSFVPTKDLYSFPPNVNSRYPSPLDSKQASPSDTVSSYLPPAAGPLDNSKFVGPVSPDLLPKDMSGGGYRYDPPQTQEAAVTGYHYDAPRPPLDIITPGPKTPDNPPPPPPPPMEKPAPMIDMGPPAPPMDEPPMDEPPMDESPPDHDHDHHDHDHDHHDYHDLGGYTDDKEYPTPPPGYVEDHDHFDHHSHHHPDIDFAHGPYFHDHHHDHDFDHHYPDVIYDDYHDHHDHFHHDHIEHHTEPPPMPTEPAPPPPPPPAPEQPRVKKYSYFYIGRKLWYIPLYFTLWFTFYVLWLILKSIARHKVNLPNHYVNRRSIEELNHREAREAIDKLTIKVMDGIEKFKLRFIG